MWFCGETDCRIIDSQLTEVVLNSGGDGRRISNFVEECGQVIAGRVKEKEKAEDDDDDGRPSGYSRSARSGNGNIVSISSSSSSRRSGIALAAVLLLLSVFGTASHRIGIDRPTLKSCRRRRHLRTLVKRRSVS